MRTKNAALNLDAIGGNGGFEAFNQFFGYSWWGGFDKTGATTFARIGIEGELRDDQSLPIDIEQRPVHFAFIIAKDPQVDNFLHQGLYLGLAIIMPHAQQYQQPLPYPPNNLPIHGHARRTHTL